MALESELSPVASSDTMSILGNASDSSPFSQELPAIRASQLSAAFATISEQLAQASDIFSGVQSSSSSAQNVEHGRLTPELESLHARLDAIEQAQSVLSNDIERIKVQVVDSEQTRVSTPVPVVPAASSSSVLAQSGGVSHERIEELEKKLQQLADIVKLESVLLCDCTRSVHANRLATLRIVMNSQDRLYSRLHNATASIPKMSIMAPATASGKPPPNFPATKGEFEHLTSCVSFTFLLCPSFPP